MDNLTVKDKPAVPATNNADRPAAPKQQVQNEQVPEEKDNFVTQQGTPKKKEKEKDFNVFKATWGFAKGFVKEAFSIAFFIPKLLFNLVTDPVNTAKGFANGFLALGKLLFSPSELVKVLGNAWEQFKAADSDQKGQVIGRILANCICMSTASRLLLRTIPMPSSFRVIAETLPKTIIGNPLLLNVRILSEFKRLGISIKALTGNVRTNGLLQTIRKARIIRKKANLEKDFRRALKLEGIPAELAPKLEVRGLELPFQFFNESKYIGAYNPSTHAIYINEIALKSFFCPSWFLGGFVRHEVRHAGQALLAARVGGPIPTRRSLPGLSGLSEMELRELIKHDSNLGSLLKFMPEEIWNKAYTLAPLKKGILDYLRFPTKYKKAKQIPGEFEKAERYGVEYVLSSNSLIPKLAARKRYMNCLLEKEAWRAQARYTGLIPAIPTPSIHNLPRLAPLAEDKEDRNSTNDTTAQQGNGNKLDRAA